LQPTSVHDITQAADLLHGEETTVWADAGYRGIEKRPETQEQPVTWKVAMMPGRRKQLDTRNPIGALINTVERTKASIRAKVEHPFRVIKCQFGFTKVRYRGLKKNTAQLITLFALSNLWMVRKQVMLWGARA
jgi:IS5 family transposase